jgi:hypothetical protein
MVVNGKSAAAFGIVSGLVFTALLAASQAGCAGASSSGGDKRAAVSPASVSSSTLPTVSVRRPVGPSAYPLPRRALRVSSSPQLVAALGDGRPEAIVLAPGTYDNAGPFFDRDGDRIYASGLGKAVLRAGVVLGANGGAPGAAIRGIRFDVSSPAKTFQGAIVHVWGSAKHAAVLDTSFNGNGVVDAGLVVRQPEGFVARRLVARSFRSYGVVVDPNQDGYQARSPYVLTDLNVSRVARPVPGSSEGTAEACLWLGSTGTVRRVSVRRCAISGIWTGSANTGSRIEDASVDRTRVGVYIEHFTTGTTFRRLRVGPNVTRGVNAEWANHAVGGKPASVDNVIEDGYFETAIIGVYLDQGTTRTSVRRCKFVAQTRAAIGSYRGIDNRFYDNDFRGIASSAVPVSYEYGGGR